MSIITLSVAFLLTSISLIPNFGSFEKSFTPIILLLIAYLILILCKIKQFDGNGRTRKFESTIIPLLFLITYFFYAYNLSGWWVVHREIILSVKKLAFFIFPFLIVFAFWKPRDKKIKSLFFLLFIMAAFLERLAMLRASPQPPIDVYVILNEAPQKLLAGINPYNTMYTHVFPGITPDYFSYWPAAFLLQIPFISLFHDPRVLHLLADIIAGIIIFLIGGKTFTSQLLSLTYLFRPHSLYIIEGSWLTPLNFFFITLITYLCMKISKLKSQNYEEEGDKNASDGVRPKNSSDGVRMHSSEVFDGSDSTRKLESIYSSSSIIPLGILLGLLTAVQFFHVIIFFFLGKFLHWGRKFIFSYIITICFVTLPFFILSPQKFFLESIWIYFRNPPAPWILIHTSLSLNSLLFKFTGKDVSSLPLYSALFLLFAFLLYKQKNSITEVVGNVTLFFFSLFIFGRQAFVNYYYFVASLILLWTTLQCRSENYN